MVSIKRWNEPEKFWDLVEEWTALLKSLNYQNAFMTSCWLGLTYDYFAKDEELNLFEIRDEASRLVGIIPLVASRVNGEVTIEFPSWHGFGHYDFIIDQKHRNESISEMLRLMRGNYVGESVHLRLGPMMSISPNIWPLEKSLKEMGIGMEKEEVATLPYLELPGSMDELILSLKPADRKKFTRWVKRAHRLADMEILRVNKPQEMDSALDKLFHMMQLLGKEVDLGVEAFLRESARVLSNRGAFEIFYLKADSWPVAVAVVMKFDSVVHILIEDVDPEAMGVQAGAVLFVHIVETAINEGMKRIEILDEIEGFSIASLKESPLYILKADMN